ncbi:hypothetical protein OG474_31965 [Kribbella sp. NBC_01505]|uniref:hypothetical protein n=1 Tax=Kribbella sp. NBC_01505 TaxID=2903580 RepID=UPI00386638BF
MATLVAVIAMLAVGCSDTSTGGSAPETPGTTAPSTTATPEPTTAEPTSEPPPEPTVPESTQPRQVKPSINLATAPVGGGSDQAAVRQCAQANWLAGAIPPGTTVTLGSVHLEPGNIFKLSQSSCPNGHRKCSGFVWKASNRTQPCYVGVVQVANSDEDKTVSVVIKARITCATKQDCRSVQAAAKKQGSQVGVSPVELPSKTPTPTPTLSPEPTKTVETPTGG